MSFDFIVVGSGIAGTSAAYQLRGKNLLMLDVGNSPDNELSLDGNLYDLKKTRPSLFNELIGNNYESMHNIANSYISPKLKSPSMQYITSGVNELSPIISENFNAVISFSRGGLANAWGGGLLRYTSSDLIRFPISVHDLDPYYNILTKHIGVTGAYDDLTPFLGSVNDLYPSLDLSLIVKKLYEKYLNNKLYFKRRNISIGRTRLAVLSEDHMQRTGYNYTNLEFFKSPIPAIYTPTYTLSEMIDKGEIIYKSGYFVEKFIEEKDKVIVFSKNINTNQIERFESKKLILAAGTLNTTKIVLFSNNDYVSKLPILDNPVSFVPFLNIGMLGSPIDKSSYSGGQLNVIYHGEMFHEPIYIAVYNLTGPLRSEFALEFPLSIKGNQAALKYVLPAILMTQIFYPDKPRHENNVKIEPTGELHIKYTQNTFGRLEKYLISSLRKIGFYGLNRWCRYPQPGNSIHYAGTLPMREVPENKYETYSSGLLNEYKHIYIADPSTFPALPSKHLSFTNMANAMRVAQSALTNLNTKQ